LRGPGQGESAEQDSPPDEGGNGEEDIDSEGRVEPGFSDSGPTPSEAPEDDPELDLLVFGKRLKRKRSELIEAFDLGGLPDERIIKLAKEMAADQRLAEAKEVANQRPPDLKPRERSAR
jgi:hypothetical protein